MKIAFITGSRADWNGTGMVAKALAAEGHTVAVIATGQAANLCLSEVDGFVATVVHIGAIGAGPTVVAASAGRAIEGIANALARLEPDLVFLAGDRYETLSAATAATLLRLPIAHLAGGDRTLGSIDDRFRDAITAMASLHFTTNKAAYERLMDLHLRVDEHVYLTGSPAIDRIKATPILSRADTFDAIGLNPGKINVLVVFHPATLSADPRAECGEMMYALHELYRERAAFLVMGSNADADAHEIERLLCGFVQAMNVTMPMSACFRDNLAPQLFYSVMTHFDLMVGNSSAGVYETPSFGIPVVNIGDRQSGRFAPNNVRTCAPNRAAILHTIEIALGGGRIICENPYGDGCSTERIVDAIRRFGRRRRRTMRK